MQAKTHYLTTLTPLRGVAALLVVIFHSSLFLLPLASPETTHFIDSGWLWVDFFFILSGFIISYVYSQNFTTGISKTAYKKYMFARFARVYPLHFFALVLAVIPVLFIHLYSTSIDPAVAPAMSLYAIPTSLLLIQSMHIHSTPPLNTPSWSLSTEWWVYMLFPLFVPFFNKIKTAGRIISLIALILFFIFIMYVIGPHGADNYLKVPTINVTADFGFIRCIAGFLAGMLLHNFYNHNIGNKIFKLDRMFVLFAVSIIIAMHFGINDICIVALFAFILICAAYNNGRIKKLLDSRPLQRLGDWSFSIYMVHVPIIWMYYAFLVYKNPGLFADVSKIAPGKPDYTAAWIVCGILLILTLILAAICYRFIEVPARNYLNNKLHTKAKKVSADSVEV